MRRCFALLALLATTGIDAQTAETPADVQTILDRLDRLYRSETSYALVEMHIENPNWQRTLRMELWGEGMDKTFIVIQQPRKDAGIATLRLKSEMWNYFPKVDKVMKVPPSMMMGSWMGSDFTNDDLVKESSFTEDYHPSLGPADDPELYNIELRPKEQTATVWGKIVFVVRRHDLIPVSALYYDEKGRQMRRIDYRELRELGGRQIPAALELSQLNKEGHKTTIRYLDARFDLKMDKGIFTLRNLKKKR